MERGYTTIGWIWPMGKCVQVHGVDASGVVTSVRVRGSRFVVFRQAAGLDW